ncbi:MAG: alpha/beta hydrolase [Bacteroidetes bacterium]|jgi:hypothetical protein|nr:alpha/beta hydrolase [Bacteroidota bacterium]
MQINTLEINNTKIVEVLSETLVISTLEDATDLLGNLYYDGFDKIILYKKNITPEFFDLKTKLAGEILQKFSNYRVRLAIVGDFSNIQSQSLKDFIFESNKGKQVGFVKSKEEAVEMLIK